MSRLGSLGARLYRGEVGYDFVGKRMFWYGVSILITITAIVGLGVRGLNMGIEFEGGAVLTTPKTSASVAHTTELAEKTSGHTAIVQQLGNGGMRIQIAGLDTAKSTQVKEEISGELKVDPNKIDTQLVGPSWGEQIANKAWLGLGIFMVLVVIYLAIAFEWRMALSALIALIHDITITVGVYSLVGFEVTPGTVIGLLTILGYSLYDTVVVFDGLREGSRNVTKQTRYTYSEIANRSINSTLVRSINTTVVALLPVAGLLFIGGGLLGGGMLNDIALSLFVGLAAGAYSSIFIATPLVADFKEREPQMKALAKRVRAKRLKAEERGGAEAQEDAEEHDHEGGAPQDGGDPAPQGAAAGVVGPRGGREAPGPRPQRRQPASRGRGGRNRPSGKRR
jgi:preprotein translocase subunit SecF